eukprot:COSAG04_NODE_3266_length_2994_cov_1.822798_2_plen_577_part_00
MCGKQGELGCEERLSCWLSLSALGCRNGVAVVVRVEVVEQFMAALPGAAAPLAAAVSSGDMDGELRACCAAYMCAVGITGFEAISKAAPEARAAVEACWLRDVKGALGLGTAEVVTAECFAKVIPRVAEMLLLEDLPLACAAAYAINLNGIAHSKPLAECDTDAVFGGALNLLRRVSPSPLPGELWISTCAEVDVTSVRLTATVTLLADAKILRQAVLESASWLGPAVEETVHICKVNASAGLSARPTMALVAVYKAVSLVETAARVESQAASLLESGVLEALDYACVHDFNCVGLTLSSYAAGAAVALVGRNEGGKTLSRAAVNAVLDTWADCSDPEHPRHGYQAMRILPDARRVATMAVSDANKKLMLAHDNLLDSLVAGLVLDDDNPRRGQDGADALQEMCAGVLHELALYGSGLSVLRSHKPTMNALRVLVRVGTKDSRERATAALFELDEETRSAKRNAPDADSSSGSAKPPPHIMMSYNWDHQDVVLRVVAWLQAHGYLVWVDTQHRLALHRHASALTQRLQQRRHERDAVLSSLIRRQPLHSHHLRGQSTQPIRAAPRQSVVPLLVHTL